MGNNLDSALVSLAATFAIATGEQYRLEFLQSKGKGLLYVWGAGTQYDFEIKLSGTEDTVEILEGVWAALKKCYTHDMIEQGRN